MYEYISPKYLMKLIEEVEKAIWKEYSSYKNVRLYIEKWNVIYDDFGNRNFYIVTKENKDIDLTRTLHEMSGDILLKIAIDLGVDTPGFIPCIPTFRNDLKRNYEAAFASFEKALKQIEEHPDLAIGLANSTLESLIKEMFQDVRVVTKYDRKKTLYALTADILREFRMFPDNSIPEEIRNIGSALLNLCQNIEKLRSNKTIMHGKASGDYVVTDPMYAYFVVNSLTTVGLFMSSFYKRMYPPESETEKQEEPLDDLPF